MSPSGGSKTASRRPRKGFGTLVGVTFDAEGLSYHPKRSPDAGDADLRRELRSGRQAADRSPEDGRGQQVPSDLDRSPRGRGDPDEAAERVDAAADDT